MSFVVRRGKSPNRSPDILLSGAGVQEMIDYHAEKKHVTSPLLLLLLVFSTCTQAEKVDHGTARQGMHACPLGMYMTGIHVGNNLLLCENLGQGYSISEERLDRTTADFNMHACPRGFAMTGIHVADNILLCAPLRDGSSLRFVDALPTARQYMHACPRWLAMVGVHVGNNHLLCQYKR